MLNEYAKPIPPLTKDDPRLTHGVSMTPSLGPGSLWGEGEVIEVRGSSGMTRPSDFNHSFSFELYGSDMDAFATPDEVKDRPFPVLGDVGEVYHLRNVVDEFALCSVSF